MHLQLLQVVEEVVEEVGLMWCWSGREGKWRMWWQTLSSQFCYKQWERAPTPKRQRPTDLQPSR